MKVGIPSRPMVSDIENDILPLLPESERAFVRGLYDKAENEERYILKSKTAKEDLDRYWKLLADTGRNSARIATVIDIKAPPDSISKERFASGLEDALTPEEQAVFSAAYEYDELTQAWYLIRQDEALLNNVLDIMVKHDYSGAIRHVNQIIPVTVTGVINAPDPKLNNNMAFIPLAVLQDESGLMLNGAVTELAIRKQNAHESALPGKDESAQAITDALQAQGITLPDTLGVEPWQAYSKDFIAASQGDDWSTRIMIIMLFIISFLGIANTMLLSILERIKEIGMMRALGMTDAQLIFTMMMESGMIGLIGSACGILIGCLINIPMVRYGIDASSITDAMGGDIGYRVASTWRSAWNFPVIVLTGVAAVVISAFMAVFPVRNALRMSVTDSLRFE